jgi:hypothetical protein
MMAKKKIQRAIGSSQFPKVMYVAESECGDFWTVNETPEDVIEERARDVIIGVYRLDHVARVTAEVKVTPCGPSKAKR